MLLLENGRYAVAQPRRGCSYTGSRGTGWAVDLGHEVSDHELRFDGERPASAFGGVLTAPDESLF